METWKKHANVILEERAKDSQEDKGPHLDKQDIVANYNAIVSRLNKIDKIFHKVTVEDWVTVEDLESLDEHYNFMWRKLWNKRVMVSNHSSRAAAINRARKIQSSYPHELKIEEHPKDGYVVYYDPQEVAAHG